MSFHTSPTVLAAGFCALAITAGSAQAAGPNFSGNVYIDGSLCVGFDCVFGQAFGSDTIILKENNLRILFDDTSTTASYPRNDWRLETNSGANGGESYFAIQDATAGRYVFRAFAGARANALVIDSQGDLGLGTTSPVGDIEVVTGNTPTIRLQQDGSSGFAAQTWDLAGNEAGFFIRDATNGSTLPFRIIPGASSQALVIDDDDDIGISTGTNPTARLHVKDTDINNNDIAKFEGAGIVLFNLISTTGGAAQYRMISDDDNRRFVGLNSNLEVKSQMIFADDSVRLAGPTDSGANLWAIVGPNGIQTQGPDCAAPNFCDKVFDPALYTPPSIKENAAFMWENKHLPAVGPTGPDLPFNLTQKSAGMLHELEKAHIYIEQLHDRIEALETEAAASATLAARLDALETALATR